ncbi:nucleotidyltransferase family protein [Pseudaestuariivita rosea]|uniref:nucleotidyltransferase family protein n=1 Tax=Pseudaestuariivita rosea TaxID=2763263 RepID=UPI001F265DD0|nr:nucleotidyltransferase family protein [Pseudaestuariivita rosea]
MNKDRMDVVIFIPAAGQSSRMRGADKLLELVDGVPLIRAQVDKALATGKRVVVAVPALDHPRAAALSGLDITLISLPESAEGLGGTLRGAVAHLQGQTDRLMILLADLPDLTTRDINTVLDGINQAPEAQVWRGVTQDGQPGHPIVFDRSLFPLFAEIKGDDGGQAVVKAAKTVHLIPLPDQRARCDLDTPEDWAAWRERTGR